MKPMAPDDRARVVIARPPAGTLLSSLAGPGAFRMALALIVFVSHVSNFEVGRPAVFIFFVLSGYWVARLYEASNGDVAGFELGRFLRIWPQFALVALAAWLLLPLAGLPRNGNFASTLPLLGLASRNGDLLGVSWSLDIEAQFYLLLPLLYLFARAMPRLPMPAVAVALAVATLIGTALLPYRILTVFAFAPAFAAGIWIWRSGWAPGWRSVALSLAAFALVGLVFAAVPSLRTLLLKDESQWWRDSLHMAWCLMLVPVVAWNVRQRSDARDRDLGNLSYPFYLIHPLMIRIGMALGATLGMAGMGQKVISLVLSLVVSIGFYSLIDRPLERFRKHLTRRLGDAKRLHAVAHA